MSQPAPKKEDKTQERVKEFRRLIDEVIPAQEEEIRRNEENK